MFAKQLAIVTTTVVALTIGGMGIANAATYSSQLRADARCTSVVTDGHRVTTMSVTGTNRSAASAIYRVARTINGQTHSIYFKVPAHSRVVRKWQYDNSFRLRLKVTTSHMAPLYASLRIPCLQATSFANH